MAEQQTESHEELLQSALSTSFTPISLTSSTSETPSEPERAPPASTEGTASSEELKKESAQPLVSPEEYTKWNEEYAEMDRSWKAESAARRTEIDERNAKFEAAGGEKTWEKLGDTPGPQNPLLNESKTKVIEVSSTTGAVKAQPISEVHSYPAEPSPADARDLTSGEPERSKTESHAAETSEASAHNDQSHLSQSQRWTEIGSDPSLESSFPSLSIPSQPQSQSDSTSPSQPPPHHHHPHHHTEKDAVHGHHHSREKQKHTAPPPATLAIFDSRLSTRSRLLALASSLAINLFLPFVNGMMLGFGEIFGRALLARFGWKIPDTPGGAATAVGVNAVPKSAERPRR